MTETRKRWNLRAQTLVGRTITGAAYMPSKEAEAAGWYSAPLILTLDDGSIIVPQSDDEGNDGGALVWYRVDGQEGFPVLGLRD